MLSLGVRYFAAEILMSQFEFQMVQLRIRINTYAGRNNYFALILTKSFYAASKPTFLINIAYNSVL